MDKKKNYCAEAKRRTSEREKKRREREGGDKEGGRQKDRQKERGREGASETDERYVYKKTNRQTSGHIDINVNHH